MRILVTGAGGFSGRHMVEYLRKNSSAEICGSSLRARNGENWVSGDLTSEGATATLIGRIRPNQVYHLAGRHSNDFQTDYRANVLSTRNLLESVVNIKLECRVLLIGSSAEYGAVAEEDNPVKEDHPLAPMSIYGLTKVYQTYLMRFYCAFYDMNIVMARPFNLFGMGMSGELFVGRVYEQIEAYRAGIVSKITVGNLEHRRDYIGIEQAIRYYTVIMQRGKAREIYNVGSGASIKVRDLLQRILEENGLGMDVVEERAFRPTSKFDVKDLFADVSKLKALMGA